MRGSCTRPRAISTRRRMPPERCFTGLSRHSRELHGLEQLVDKPLAALARHAVKLREDDEILLDAELGSLVSACGMTPIVRRTSSDCFDDIRATDGRAARRRRHQRRQHADERRLPGAVRPEQPEDLPCFTRTRSRSPR